MSERNNAESWPPLPERAMGPEVSGTFMNRIQRLETRAETLGISMHFATEVNNVPVHESDHLMFGASLGKLPLADMVINVLPHDRLHEWKETGLRDRTGGGELDRISAITSATVEELLDDMLRNSGNTAYRVLAQGLEGPEAINRFYRAKWHQTRVEIDPATGRAATGKTTPSEALAQLKEVLFGYTGSVRLQTTAQIALLHSTATNRGIRRFTVSNNELSIYNKTGDYNGDANDPYIFRHDVGYVEGPEKSVAYAVMTQSPQRVRGAYRHLANSFVAQFGAEIAREAGGADVTTLGSRALRYVL